MLVMPEVESLEWVDSCACWPVTLAFSLNSRPMRDSVSKKEKYLFFLLFFLLLFERADSWDCLLAYTPTYMHTPPSHMYTHTHIDILEHTHGHMHRTHKINKIIISKSVYLPIVQVDPSSTS